MVKLPKRFSVGERVFAKVRGYPPWPAKIENITDPNTKHAKYHVVFFGTKEIGTCKIEDLFHYADNKDKFSKTVRRKYFHEGIQELEEDLKKNPNPASVDSSRDVESAENVPENVTDNLSEKEGSEIHITASGGDGDNDSGNLIIDEGDKKKAIKRKSQLAQNTPDVAEVKKKRGRKSLATTFAENAAKQDSAHESQDEDSEKKVVSRSGRKIKPKRFHDYSDAEIPIDPTRNDQSVRSRTKIKTEESIENQETPITPIKKRMSVEKDDKKVHVKDEAEIQNQIRLRILRTEEQLTDYDTQIRASLGLDQANTDDCLEAMDQILELEITSLMLKKHSRVVETIKRLRRYIGNLAEWKLNEEETVAFKEKAEKIQKKAEFIYNKLKTLFTIPEGQTFWTTFTELVQQFKEHTKDMSGEEVYALIEDPTPIPTVSEPVKPTTSAAEESSSTEVTIPIKSEESVESGTNKNVSEVKSETK